MSLKIYKIVASSTLVKQASLKILEAAVLGTSSLNFVRSLICMHNLSNNCPHFPLKAKKSFVWASITHPRWESSMPNMAVKEVKYEEIKNLTPEKMLIDVREPRELQQTGRIPRSINISLGNINNDLSPHADEKYFLQKYGLRKPKNDTELIFYCKSGVRAQRAAQAAVALGYRNVKNYLGSWEDWAKREGLAK